jgi:hypothetical protein
MSWKCAIQPCDWSKRKRVCFYFALDLFCIYVIRSQHKQYWGPRSSGMWHCVVRWMFPNDIASHPRILGNTAGRTSDLMTIFLAQVFKKIWNTCNVSFCIATRNDHFDHKVCLSNTVLSALHIVIIKTTVYDNFLLFLQLWLIFLLTCVWSNNAL